MPIPCPLLRQLRPSRLLVAIDLLMPSPVQVLRVFVNDVASPLAEPLLP